MKQKSVPLILGDYRTSTNGNNQILPSRKHNSKKGIVFAFNSEGVSPNNNNGLLNKETLTKKIIQETKEENSRYKGKKQ